MRIEELFDIAGRTVLITGARGLYGAHITEAFAEAGCRIALASRNLPALKTFATELGERGFEVPLCFDLDQGDTRSIEHCIEGVTDELGDLDILVNNAVLRPMKSFHDEVEHFAESMKVNATGLFHITRIVGDAMCRRGTGSIINIASIQGVIGVDPTLYEETEMTGTIPDYYFHKGGMINLTRMLASHFGRYGVRVNAISPGGLYNNQDPVFVKRYNARTFLGRMAEADDIKGVVVFLASEASRYITGENIMMDGGYVQK